MRLGILGGGQLARMLAVAAHRLGISSHVLDPTSECCAAQVAHHHQIDYTDQAKVLNFAKDCTVLTCDSENIPAATLDHLQAHDIPLHPNSVRYFQDRCVEKTFLAERGLPVANFTSLSSLEQLREFAASADFPKVLKQQTMGYDGKGQYLLTSASDVDEASKQLALNEHNPILAEDLIQFDREVSLVAVRDHKGQFQNYPLCENYHSAGILRYTLVGGQETAIAKTAVTYARELMHTLDYVGVMTIEFFQVGDELVINEVAPRVHNSGHWTIEGTLFSQFDNHVHAIFGLPLGEVKTIYPYSAMLNLIGQASNNGEEHDEMMVTVARHLPPYARLHHYVKQHRPARKLGHIFVPAADETMLYQRLQAVCTTIGNLTDLYDLNCATKIH